MLTIYHSSFSRSTRVLWLAEELGLSYQLQYLDMFSEAMRADDYLAVHPLGKVPAIDDNGFVLWDTAAIAEYLIAKYSDGSLLPARDTQWGAQVIQWMMFAENPLTILLGEIVAHGGVMPEARRVPALVDRGNDEVPALIAVVERALQGREYIVGEQLSMADIMLGFALTIAQYLGMVAEHTPNCLQYCQRLTQRPAYIRASAQ